MVLHLQKNDMNIVEKSKMNKFYVLQHICTQFKLRHLRCTKRLMIQHQKFNQKIHVQSNIMSMKIARSSYKNSFSTSLQVTILCTEQTIQISFVYLPT